jgi:hypothetical protein
MAAALRKTKRMMRAPNGGVCMDARDRVAEGSNANQANSDNGRWTALDIKPEQAHKNLETGNTRHQ